MFQPFLADYGITWPVQGQPRVRAGAPQELFQPVLWLQLGQPWPQGLLVDTNAGVKVEVTQPYQLNSIDVYFEP